MAGCDDARGEGDQGAADRQRIPRIDAYGLDMQVMSPTSSGVQMQSTDSLLAAGSGLISGLSAVIAPVSQLASVASGDKDP